jgi:hypothetical protein
MLKLLTAFFVIIIGLSSCKPSSGSVMNWLDRLAFCSFGGTVIASPAKMKMKDIQLGSGSLIGKEVIINGSVDAFGEHKTYLVVSDETARILVVLTDLDEPLDPKVQKAKSLRIWGTVGTGKKGLPVIHAAAIKVTKSEKAS